MHASVNHRLPIWTDIPVLAVVSLVIATTSYLPIFSQEDSVVRVYRCHILQLPSILCLPPLLVVDILYIPCFPCFLVPIFHDVLFDLVFSHVS